MDILALDIGTKVGFAYNQTLLLPETDCTGRYDAGTWALASDTEVKKWGKARLTRRNDPRIRRLCDNIAALGAFDVIVFEDVEFQTYRMQTQLWSALRSSLWLCGLAKHFECVNVTTLKKFATGAGNADKAAMSKALKRRHPKLWTPWLDDNGIDAVWLWLWGQENLSRLKL